MKCRTIGYLLFVVVVCCSLSSPLQANNIRSKGTVQITAGAAGSGMATLSFELSWDNSWRDSYNWDAAWIFLKYNAGGVWKHVMLKTDSHTLNNDYSYMPGKSGSNAAGLFIYRQNESAGTSTVTCNLQWVLPSEFAGYTQKEFDENGVYVLAQGIEMVYIPYGAYSLGDGASYKRLEDAAKQPVLVADENLASVSVNGGSTVALSANYPRGYQGFYVMKYEVSQEQYVAFLNTLTLAQQKQLLPGVEALSKGQYIFGSSAEPTNRNGIVVSKVSDGTQPIVFDNNLNKNDKYGEDGDGKCVACNYMSVQDLLAYCSWSGLRPMSEMEYEKACRHPYPDRPVAGEYAWNDASAPKGVSSLETSSIGMRTERPGDAGSVNVNFNNLLTGVNAGPVRCGSFAAKQPGQSTAGATYWGVMEMSGNLSELCCNVAHTTLDRALHGDGAYSLSKWTTDPAKFGYRGGDFTSSDSLLRISDRSQAAAVTSLTTRGKGVGFRGVYSLDGTAVTVDPKTISMGGDSVVCSGSTFTVSGDEATVADGSTLPFTYIWLVKKPGTTVFEVIPDEAGSTLTYTDGFVNTGTTKITYVFKRKAVCALGEGVTPEFTFAVINPSITLSATTATIDACDNGTAIMASSVMTDVTPRFQWIYGGVVVDSNAIYRSSSAHFPDLNVESKTVICRADILGCIETATLVVNVPKIQQVNPDQVTLANCGRTIVVDNRYSPQAYCTVLIPGGVREGETLPDQCWFGRNMNVGTRVPSSNYSTHTTAGIQRICYNNDETMCDKYGGLYSWEETVYGENTSEFKYALDNPGAVQGICPDGWHVPSDAEWQILERNLGMTKAVANTTGWRGTDQGTQMKMPGTFEGVNWCTGADCNKSGFNGLPGGYRYLSGGSFAYLGTGTYWWSSTVYDATYAWRRNLNNAQALVGQNNTNRTHGFSVRCVRNLETVASTAVTMENCGKVVVKDAREATPQYYNTVKIPGTGGRPDQCWFGQNMNIGDRVPGSDFTTHTVAGIQKICYADNEANCKKYGGLYSWDETVNAENADAVKYVSGLSGSIQGICPDGWHVPSDNEFKALEMNLGMTQAEADKINVFRGTDQGTQMKMPGTFEGLNWCAGADCNKSGFNGLPSGRRLYTNGKFLDLGGYTWWWSSTLSDTANVWERCLNKDQANVNRNNPSRSYGFSVRCIKNLEVASTAVTMENCGQVVVKDEREAVPQYYNTVKIRGTGGRADQCWFSQNMNIGTVVPGADYNTHTVAGIQKICCNNDESSCDKYGGLYNWNEAVNGEKANAIKYVSGSSGAVQGICPNGWHMPSAMEVKTLELNLGMIQSEADKINAWRGTNQGAQLKMPGIFEGTNWCVGVDCNKSGFDGLPSGWRDHSGGVFISSGNSTYWWSSTVNGGIGSYHGLIAVSSQILQYYAYNSFALSVRCIRN